jgi:hypothetical protein
VVSLEIEDGLWKLPDDMLSRVLSQNLSLGESDAGLDIQTKMALQEALAAQVPRVLLEGSSERGMQVDIDLISVIANLEVQRC